MTRMNGNRITMLGTIPRGFRMKDGSLANICPHY